MCKFYNKDKLINYLIGEVNRFMDNYCELSNKNYRLVENLRKMIEKYDNNYHNYMIPVDEIKDLLDGE